MLKLEAALAWAARGFRVFPLHPNSDVPAILAFPQRATRDPNVIRGWWAEDTEYNIGCVPENQVMVDLDIKKGKQGISNYQSLGIDLYNTLAVRTRSGGIHLYYEGPPTANSAGRIADGIDTRGPHGYVVAPGSLIDGQGYEVVNDLPLAPVPLIVLEKLRAPRERDVDQTPLIDLDTESAIAIGKRILDDTPGATAGVQNNTLFMLAAYLRDLAISEGAAADLLSDYFLPKCSPPIEYDNMVGVVANAYLYAQNRPGSKHPMADFDGVVQPLLPTAEDWPGIEPPQEDENPFMRFGNMVALADLKPRPWILHKFLLRGEVSVLLAPGGVGKSQLILTAAVCLALGWPELFGFKNFYVGRPQKSIIYNAEDNEEEMSMRLHATCISMQIDVEAVKPYIVLVSGRTLRMKLVTGGRTPTVDAEAKKIMGWLINAARCHDAAMLGLDVLNKLHEVDENSNSDMGRMMELLAELTRRANVGTVLAHHLAKPGSGAAGSYAGNVWASRGAGEIISGARGAFTLSPPTEEDVSRLGLPPDRARMYLRLDDAKLNRALIGGEPAWIEKVSVDLPNGEQVGAFFGANMRALVDANRRDLGEAIRAHMQSIGAASLTVTQAVTILQKFDPIYEQMAVVQSKSRLERFLSRPIEVSDNLTVQMLVTGREKLVVLQ